jgi:hypothetical protein
MLVINLIFHPNPQMPRSTVMPDPTTCWNNKFFNLVGHAHPSIWRVIEWCQKEEATVRTIIQQDAVFTFN